MRIRCLGGWTDDAHDPVFIGQKEPLADTRISDAACDRCCRAMSILIDCRRCGKVPTFSGLCQRCENQLETHLGEPAFRLSVFRAGAEPLVGPYDGAGVMLRLRAAMKEPDYCGFALEALAGVPR
jgi:hypothetical protein